jgi:hypothetical protein
MYDDEVRESEIRILIEIGQEFKSVFFTSILFGENVGHLVLNRRI